MTARRENLRSDLGSYRFACFFFSLHKLIDCAVFESKYKGLN